MKARLLMTFPAEGLPSDTEPPLAPTIVVDAGVIGLFTTDFTRQFNFANLALITEADIRSALCLDERVFVYLSPIRELPGDDLYSNAMLAWRQDWWREIFTCLRPFEGTVQTWLTHISQ